MTGLVGKPSYSGRSEARSRGAAYPKTAFCAHTPRVQRGRAYSEIGGFMCRIPGTLVGLHRDLFIPFPISPDLHGHASFPVNVTVAQEFLVRRQLTASLLYVGSLGLHSACRLAGLSSLRLHHLHRRDHRISKR